MENKIFETLNAINVNGHIETKQTGKASLKYLSWPWAWAEVQKNYPNASYEIVRQSNGLPYVYDEATGYMVTTKVTIEGVTHEMWLPVMDSHNDAMLNRPRTVKTKYGSYTVEPCTMFDINKTIMRCLVKNLAMFGLGLYIYAGEDLPEDSQEQYTTAQPVIQNQTQGHLSQPATQQPQPINTNALQDAIMSAQFYLQDARITPAWKDKVNGYIQTSNIEGIEKFNQWAKQTLSAS